MISIVWAVISGDTSVKEMSLTVELKLVMEDVLSSGLIFVEAGELVTGVVLGEEEVECIEQEVMSVIYQCELGRKV